MSGDVFMKVVILAGGFGTRTSEESYLKPKPMLEIGGKPILWHIMKEYSFYGFNEFIVCCGYKQHMIIATLTAARAGQRYGVLDIKNHTKVRAFHEKGLDGNLRINAGYMVLEPTVFHFLENDSTIFEKNPLETMAAMGELQAYLFDGYWQCMDTKREMELLEKLWDTGQAPWKNGIKRRNLI